MRRYAIFLFSTICLLVLSACHTPTVAETVEIAETEETAETADPSATPSAVATATTLLTDTPASIPPTETPVVTPSPTQTPLPPEPQRIEFKSGDGTNLVGLYWPAAVSPAPGVILMHQSLARCDKSGWVDLAPILQGRSENPPDTGPQADRSYAVFTFDSRGHGESEGEHDEAGILEDARAALATFRSLPGVDPDNIIMVGGDIGADAAVDACGEGCAGAISLSPGGYLNVPYADALAELGDKPVLCVAAEGDQVSADTCREGESLDLDRYETQIYQGDKHGRGMQHLTEEPLLFNLTVDWIDQLYPVEELSAEAQPGLTADQVWVHTGGPPGGLGYDIRAKPGDPNMMYVTDAFAGVHISTDGGLTWHSSNEGIDLRFGPAGGAVPVLSLTIDPNDPDIIWIGMQGVRGIFRSDDGGQTWKRRSEGVTGDEGLAIRGLAVEPGNSDVVYAAGEISSWRCGEEMIARDFDPVTGVVYKSVNGGLSWELIWNGKNLARYILIDPRDPNVLYVSTGIFDREASNVNPPLDPGGIGILKSTDGGSTWTVIDEDNGLTGLYISSLFMHPDDPDILFAGTGHSYWSRAGEDKQQLSPAGVFISTDGGESWDKTLDADLISAVEVCSDPDIVYAAGDHVFFRSDDGGYTWQDLGYQVTDFWGPAGLIAGFPIDMQCDERDPMRLFVNNYGGGNFLTRDGGKTWTDASQGYTGSQMRRVIVDPDNPARAYAGGRSGLFRTENGGESWTGLAFPPARYTSVNAFAVSPADFDWVISSSWDLSGKLALSSDGGLNWELVTVPLAGEDQQFLDFVFAPSDPETVYAAVGHWKCKYGGIDCVLPGSGILVSHDAGRTWESANDIYTAQMNISVLAVDPNDPQIVYAATRTHGLFKTKDGGAHWGHLPIDLLAIFSLEIDPANPDRIFAGTSDGIRFSDDAGESWDWASIGMDHGAFIKDVVIDPANPQTVWAADLMSGVYRSTDGGQVWVHVNDGLLSRAVGELGISRDGKTVYASTEGGGIFRWSSADLAESVPAKSISTSAGTGVKSLLMFMFMAGVLVWGRKVI